MIAFRLRILVLLVTLAMVCATPAAAQQSLRIAAVVNDDIVSVYDLTSRVDLVVASSNLPNNPEVRKRLAPKILRVLIDERLKMQEAKRMGITVPEARIQSRIQDIERQNKLPPGGLAKQLASIGQDLSAVTGQIEAELAWTSSVRAQFKSRVQVGEREIDAALKRLEETKDKPRYLVAEILLPVANPADDAAIRGEAERLLQEIQSGADFSILARNFSRGATAGSGGNLGWVREGELGTELDAALTRMAPGQVAGPVRDLDGYRLLLLRKKQVGDPRQDPGETRVAISQIFLPLAAGATVQQVGNTMEKGRTLGARARTCKDMDALGREVGSAMSGSLGTVRMKDLPTDLRATVAGLPVARASAPQRTKDGVVVLMVCERIAPEPPKPPSREDIKRKLLNDRLTIRAERYLRDLRRQAIIDIRL